MNLFPDPFDEPLEYWHMIMNCIVTPEWKKRQQLQTVGLDYDNPPEVEKCTN